MHVHLVMGCELGPCWGFWFGSLAEWLSFLPPELAPVFASVLPILRFGNNEGKVLDASLSEAPA